MKQHIISAIGAGIMVAAYILLSFIDVYSKQITEDPYYNSASDDQHKIEAFAILEAKCNTCHKKKNPFMVFKIKNISKRAKSIFKVLFEVRTMPKGNEVKLTTEEYTTLKKWLLTNIN